MELKQTISLMLVIFILTVFVGCNMNDNSDPIYESTTVGETKAENIFEYASVLSEESTTELTLQTTETIMPQIQETTTTESTAISKDDPSQWSKSKIIEVYKKAAENSSSAKSKQDMSLADISLNDGSGAINSMFKLIKPIITGILASNSTEFDGITGGHQNIVDTDVATAKAYSSGDNTVIEMTMVEQTDGAHGDRLSGTVGHAISVVGDVSSVLDMLSDAGLSVSVPDDGISMIYTKPILKILIDGNGNIINGSWSYNVDILLTNYSVGSANVEKTSVSIDYLITVNGGFSE